MESHDCKSNRECSDKQGLVFMAVWRESKAVDVQQQNQRCGGDQLQKYGKRLGRKHVRMAMVEDLWLKLVYLSLLWHLWDDHRCPLHRSALMSNS